MNPCYSQPLSLGYLQDSSNILPNARVPEDNPKEAGSLIPDSTRDHHELKIQMYLKTLLKQERHWNLFELVASLSRSTADSILGQVPQLFQNHQAKRLLFVYANVIQGDFKK